MPKVVTKKFSQRPEKKKDDKAAASASAASAASRAFGPLFNKDLGQHILKNPLVAQGIVDKVGLQEKKERRKSKHEDQLLTSVEQYMVLTLPPPLVCSGEPPP